MHARIPRLRWRVIFRAGAQPATPLRMWAPVGILHVCINIAALLALFAVAPVLDLFGRDRN